MSVDTLEDVEIMHIMATCERTKVLIPESAFWQIGHLSTYEILYGVMSSELDQQGKRNILRHLLTELGGVFVA